MFVKSKLDVYIHKINSYELKLFITLQSYSIVHCKRLKVANLVKAFMQTKLI